ncbi:type VI secretion system tube protein TssD [Aquimarina algicola]|uniref:Uncharacterized protein n=1 Tax=Aquimarina algicola TaxID=2589995 RepID=A0A504J7Z9_9FLAO|nr:type VI secretion system tube protein TssD [Aquimarina algicola]TPN82810.1 hypothetical protein FHK87_20500 [Aquimarina algicola]
MSIKIKLRVDDKEYTVDHIDMGFIQYIDPTGRPWGKPKNDLFTFEIPITNADATFFEWSIDRIMQKNAYLDFIPVQENTKTRKLELHECYCVKCTYLFNASNKEPFKVRVQLSPSRIVHNGENKFEQWWATPQLPEVEEQEEVEEQQDPRIINSYWAYDREGLQPYTYNKDQKNNVALGTTMYFHIQTRYLEEDTVLNLQLFDYDRFFWAGLSGHDTDKFPNKPVKTRAIVMLEEGEGFRGRAVAEIQLSETWEPVIREDTDNIAYNNFAAELYWVVNCTTGGANITNVELPEGDDSKVLRVTTNNRNLYFKSGFGDMNLPELRSGKDGSPIFLLKAVQDKVKDKIKGKVTEQVTKAISTVAQNKIDDIVLAKLADGNIVMSDMQVYRHPNAPIRARQVYDNEGRLREVNSRHTRAFNRDGQRVDGSTSNYDFFAQDGTKVKILGGIKHVADHFSLMSDIAGVISYAMSEDSPFDKPLSLNVLVGLGLANPLTMHFIVALEIAGIFAQEIKAERDEATNAALQHDLDIAKAKGYSAVLNEIDGRDEYFLDPFDIPNIDKLLSGKITTLQELIDQNTDKRDQCNILYKKVENSQGIPVYIIETIFF